MDYLVLKRVAQDGEASDWEITTIARGLGEDDEAAAAKQGFTGDGTYKAIAWPAENGEFDLTAGPLEVSAVPVKPSEGEGDE